MLHVGCGLDSRAFRLQPGPGIEWYDVDYADVISLRERLYPPREHYHPVAASVTDPAWLVEIPADRPALFIAEGLTYYLTEDDGVALLRRVAQHFGGVDGPDDILRQVPGFYRLFGRLMSLVPLLKTMAQFHRYAF